jgi:ketosteroid isomerase-like protein
MSQTNVAFIQDLYSVYGRKDFEGVLDRCTADIEWCTTGRKDDFPAFGPRKGRAEVLDFFHTVSQAVEFSDFRPLQFYSDRDKVFVLGAYTFAMKAGGGSVTSEWIHIFTVDDGKVTGFREFLDTARVAEAYRR